MVLGVALGAQVVARIDRVDARRLGGVAARVEAGDARPPGGPGDEPAHLVGYPSTARRTMSSTISWGSSSTGAR